jgi:hypothetical protein
MLRGADYWLGISLAICGWDALFLEATSQEI